MTQNDAILRHLKRGRTITPLQALHEYGCFRLSGRIYDLRQEGHNIHMQLVETDNGKRVAEYRMLA